MPQMKKLKGIRVTVYYHVWQTHGRVIEETMCFYSKEFGWLEYIDTLAPLHFKTKEAAIKSTYKTKSIFKRFGKLIKLGEL